MSDYITSWLHLQFSLTFIYTDDRAWTITTWVVSTKPILILIFCTANENSNIGKMFNWFTLFLNTCTISNDIIQRGSGRAPLSHNHAYLVLSTSETFLCTLWNTHCFVLIIIFCHNMLKCTSGIQVKTFQWPRFWKNTRSDTIPPPHENLINIYNRLQNQTTIRFCNHHA